MLVPSVESMEGGRGTVAAHLISARAVALLLVTYFTNCRTRTSSSLTPRGELLLLASFSFQLNIGLLVLAFGT